jgi:hypothetical protein
MRKVFVVIPTRSGAVSDVLLNSLDDFLKKYAREHDIDFKRLSRTENSTEATAKMKTDCLNCFKVANASNRNTVLIIHGNNVTVGQRALWVNELMKSTNGHARSHYSITFCDMVPTEDIKAQCLADRAGFRNNASDLKKSMRANLDLYDAPKPSNFPGFDIETIPMNVVKVQGQPRKSKYIFPSATLDKIRARLDSFARNHLRKPIETSKQIQDRLDSMSGDRRKAVKVGNRPNRVDPSTPTGEQRVVEPNVYTDPRYTSLGGWERNYDEALMDDFLREYQHVERGNQRPWDPFDKDSGFYEEVGWEKGEKINDTEVHIPSNMFADDISDKVLKEMRSSE